jgi:two-component system cell cycle sensor histidine kinase/response regulator CckA
VIAVLLRQDRALVVDFDRARAQASVETLRSLGLEVTHLVDPDEALLAHRAQPFSLVVWTSRTLEGLAERCQRLRGKPGAQALLVLVPGATAADVSALLEAGATDVLVEPFAAEALRIRLFVAVRRSSVRRLAESLLAALPDLVFCISRAGQFTDFHAPDWHELYVPPERIIGARLGDLLPAEIAAGTLAAVERALATRSLQVFEYTLATPNGEGSGDFEARLVPNGEDEVLALVRNVTSQRKVLETTRNLAALEERARVQEKLLQVQKTESLGLLAGGIAHDFNNLLTAIMGSASVAALKLPESSPARAPIDALVVAARRAADLTQQLLAYSGKGRFQIRLVDLSAQIQEIVTLLEAGAPKHVQLRLALAAGLPAVECDIAQLQQVAMNLVLNAAEAIEGDRGTVLIATGRQTIDATYPAEASLGEAPTPGDYVFLEVQDDGSGMDEATQARIFDPFFTTKTTGRGLGLAAVLGIVRSHRGVLRVYSTVGRGTTFKVLFPAQTAPAEITPSAPAAPSASTGTVLIVDDENFLRSAARSILEHFGFSVLEAANGEIALELYASAHGTIDAVLLDMTMPGLSGEETFRRLRAVRPDVTVILSSGYNEIEATRRFTSKGLAGFLQKPYTASQLGEYVTQVLAARRS